MCHNVRAGRGGRVCYTYIVSNAKGDEGMLKRWLFIIAVTLVVTNAHTVDGRVYVDYILDGDKFVNVYIEDMQADLEAVWHEKAEGVVEE